MYGDELKKAAGLHDIWMAETKANAETAFDRFVTNYGAKYPKTTECISGSHCLKL